MGSPILHRQFFRFMCITAWECTSRRCWCQITCLVSANLLERLSNCRMRYICLSNKKVIVSCIWETPELRTRQRKRRQPLLKKRRRCREDLDGNTIPKWVCVWVRFRVMFRVRVTVMVRVRVRIIRFIQVKSGSHCYGHTSLFWISGLVQIDSRCNSRALMDRLSV